MSSSPFDVQRPATEVEIGDAIHSSDPATSDTIRRLAFERDKLRADSLRWRHWMRKLESFGLPIARIQANTDEELSK